MQRPIFVNADRDHRDLHGDCKAQEGKRSTGYRVNLHRNLVCPDDPRHFSRTQQDERIEQTEQEHAVRYIMLEYPDHASTLQGIPSPGIEPTVRFPDRINAVAQKDE